MKDVHYKVLIFLEEPQSFKLWYKQNFSNRIVYVSYQPLITSQQSNDNSVQYSKVEIIDFIWLQKMG
jgi:hypothetical protein